jgi:hypothetical protein
MAYITPQAIPIPFGNNHPCDVSDMLWRCDCTCLQHVLPPPLPIDFKPAHHFMIPIKATNK